MILFSIIVFKLMIYYYLNIVIRKMIAIKDIIILFFKKRYIISDLGTK